MEEKKVLVEDLEIQTLSEEIEENFIEVVGDTEEVYNEKEEEVE